MNSALITVGAMNDVVRFIKSVTFSIFVLQFFKRLYRRLSV